MATHAFVDANGATCDIENAKGIKYSPKDKAGDNDQWFTYIITDEARDMLAAFGAKTLATNTVSSFYDGLPKGAPKGTQRARKADAPADDLSGLGDRFAAIVAGDWGASQGGGGGVGYNLDDLLEALCDVYAGEGKEVNRDKVGAALRDGGTIKGAALDAKAYRKFIVSIDGVKARYEAIRTARQPTVAVDEAEGDLT